MATSPFRFLSNSLSLFLVSLFFLAASGMGRSQEGEKKGGRPKLEDYQYFHEPNGEDLLSPEGAFLTDGRNRILCRAYNAPHSPSRERPKT